MPTKLNLKSRNGGGSRKKGHGFKKSNTYAKDRWAGKSKKVDAASQT